MTTYKTKAVTFALSLSFLVGGNAIAEHAETPLYDPQDPGFRAAHPVRVFVDIDTRRKGREKHLTNFEAGAMQQLRFGLPGYVQLVSDRRIADMVIRAREQDYRFGFRVVDTDRKDKKYKKRYRYKGGQCGHFQKAYYTRIKEKGEAVASYRVKIRMRGFGGERKIDHITLRSAERFSYGTDMMARTNCGMIRTHHMPSNGVAKLFSRNTPEYRRHVAQEVRAEAATDLGRALATRIRVNTDHFYAQLSARLSQNYDYDYSYDGGSHRERFEYSHRQHHPSNQHLESDGDDVGAAMLVVTGLAILAASLDD